MLRIRGNHESDASPRRALARPRLSRGWSGRRRPSIAQARKALAVALFAAAAFLALQPAQAGGERTAPLLVAAHDLPAGATLAQDDVRVVDVPRATLPGGALTDPQGIAGRVLASAANSGEPLTDARLVGRSDGAGEAGKSTVPLRLADAGVAGLLHPGAEVDVVTVGDEDEGRQVLARNATVVTVTAARKDAVTRPAEGPLVLVAVPAQDAPRVAAVSLNQPVTVILR
jgi:Flp pilus assembly protein CpaB